ncbi:hypothetical protein CRUP_023305 [Coryphaenoides rupestris]|nr:hypothetical protein CRUP_023305 [Coryphaenoides rupestris]
MACVLLLLLLVVLRGSVGSQKVCSYQDVLDHLKLRRDNEVFTSTRPVLDHTHLTMKWHNERISWDPSKFCGITHLSIPKEMLWKPDLFIHEMTEMDNASQSPYVCIAHNGTVYFEEDLKVISTCKMDVHKFPFDTQSCNITVASILHNINELRLVPSSNSSRATQFSRTVMQTQGEWDFLNMSVANETFTLGPYRWDQIVYTISMKRRPLLHVINFLLPVLFFLCLDLSSFLISDHRGDKLGFKVTVLLAISVLLLILNEILPSMSNRTPLIGRDHSLVILKVILPSMSNRTPFIGRRDHSLVILKVILPSMSNRTPFIGRRDHSLVILKRRAVDAVRVSVIGRGLTHHKIFFQWLSNRGWQPVGAEGQLWLMLLEELREMKGLAVAWSRRSQAGNRGYWTRLAYRINVVFIIFYVTVVLLFLCLMYKEWSA